jgi:precorrin-6B methylase 2
VAAVLTQPDEIDEMAAPSYCHWNPLIRWLFWARLAHALELLRLTRLDRVWDFGAGTGVLLPSLSRACQHVYATDRFPEPCRAMVRLYGLPNVTVLQDPIPPDAELPTGSLNAIVAMDVLEHVDDLSDTVTRLRAKLAPGGRIVVSGPTESPIYKLGRVLAGFGNKGHYHHTNIFHIRKELVAHGFRDVASRRLLRRPLPRAFLIFRFERG